MCGIAGYSLSPDSQAEPTLAAQALLAGIAERGADAVGYASRGADGTIAITKLQGGASALLDEISLPAEASQALIHVRDYTKGRPEITGNNHPIRHGAVVGIHNGLIENDDALLERYGIERQEDDMTVDSEAIFALMELRRHRPSRARRAARCDGRRLDGRARPVVLYLARGVARPLWIGRTGHRSLLRVDTARARDRRGGPARAALPDRGARGPAAPGRRRRDRPVEGPLPAGTERYREEGVLPPSAPRTRPSPASSGSRRITSGLG